ncbi:MAG: L-aspartate oxidase [Acidobacteria bacterium]|nr:L-aspartate oxidase [Acidobacteriota bacterium]
MTSDFLVVGAGVAGLRAAIELAKAGRVLVVAKDSLRESSSEYAQGGIAAAVGEGDAVALHEQDTLAAGDGLCDTEAVQTLVREGPVAIQELIEWGAEFDREGARLALGREGAHSRRRILHAHGDSTGREIARALHRKAASLANVELRSFAAVTDLLLAEDGSVAGVAVCDGSTHSHAQLRARGVLLATGGMGRVYAHSTNPEVATGDGVAAAWRAGAALSDLEFVQFHPTVLAVEGAGGFLLSEALRGEGAWLRGADGERFMTRYHEMAELAPRDVVSRAIVTEMERTGAEHVWLDLRRLEADFVRRRFPRIYETCLKHGVDLTKDPAPVRPAAHYAMGGVHTDLHGRTSLPRLYAAGEVAAAGVHGANRLASNSLLEGLVFGARAGRAMRELAGAPAAPPAPPAEPLFPELSEEELRALSWRHCGIVRSGEGLAEVCRRLEATPLRPNAKPNRAMFELRSLHTLAWLIARCALARRESRGAHFRTDCPESRPEFQKHSLIQKGHEVTFF